MNDIRKQPTSCDPLALNLLRPGACPRKKNCRGGKVEFPYVLVDLLKHHLVCKNSYLQEKYRRLFFAFPAAYPNTYSFFF